jgi:hypothetical protein
MKCSCDHHNKRSCDLQFYYSDDDTISPVSKTNFGSSVIQTSSGVITNKSNTTPNYKTIGNFAQNKMCIVQTSTSAFVSNLETFYLSDGNIQLQPTGIQSLNSQGNYGLPPNATYKFTIINGTGKYLNSSGIVKIHTFDNLSRLVKIYFKPLKNKCRV